MATTFGSTSYEYDLLDRLTRVVDRNGYATAYEYDKNGNRTRVTYANGYTTTYDYDLLNRLIRQETLDNDGETVVQYVYTLGAAGERKAVSELDRTVEYTYDSLYRLTSETITEGEKVTAYTYAYDNVSNRILKTENGKETEYVYNSLNQLISDSETSYEYDLNSNLVRVIGSAQTALYEYNCENKLVKATVQSGNNVIVETYTYDYSGNRTSKTTNTNGSVEYVKYLNDNSSLTNVLAEIDETGTVKCVYTIGADLISQERDGDVSVYLYDGHGSVVGLAAMSGKVTDTYKYDAFGNLIKSTGKTVNNYLYCGEQFDGTTGLYYLRARYMDTSTGRFISQDSYAGNINDPVSLHKYLYANSNPVMYTDPSGYLSLKRFIIAEVVLGIVAVTWAMEAQSAMNIGNSLLKDLNSFEEDFINHNLEFDWFNVGIQFDYNFVEALKTAIIQSATKPFPFCDELFTNIKKRVKEKVDELQHKYNRINIHHIVAKASYKSIPSQIALTLCGINVRKDKRNLVALKQEIHEVLHTNLYYSWVNIHVAVPFNLLWTTFEHDDNHVSENQVAAVNSALLFLKTKLSTLNELI